jgi:hypothetical protein
MHTSRTLLTSSSLFGIAAVSAAIALSNSRPANASPSFEGAWLPRVVTITARDYAFDAPDTIPAGITTLRLLNNGPEMHHVFLFKLEEGKTVADLMEALKVQGPPPRWLKLAGGPNAPAPGAESNATLRLAAGRYVITCVIPSKDGTPHMMKGMMRELIVAPSLVPASTAAAELPKPDVTVTLTDYAFGASKPLVAGKQRILLRNAASQPHEAFIAQLAPGKTAQDLMAWLEGGEQGPPPAKPIGGITPVDNGGEIEIDVDLAPGTYAWFCFVPDAKDGKPHVAHGMVHEFTVAAK